jgi:hypothetical protein
MRDGARGCAILGQQQQPSMRREMQAQRIDRAAVQAQNGAIGDRPAKPRG